MEFKSVEDLNAYLKKLIDLGFGSRGTCYLRLQDKTVLKIFHGYDETDEEYIFNYSSDEILRFSDIKNKTFIWPQDIITLNGKIIGYTVPFINARNLYMTDPLTINLNRLVEAIMSVRKDIKLISNQGVVTYDMMYNILYGRKFFVIDQDEYSFNHSDSANLEEENNRNFDLEIYYFLIDAYFNKIVKDDKKLSELYKGKKEDVLIFIQLLKMRLSELVGDEVNCLKDARKYIDEDQSHYTYQRILK